MYDTNIILYNTMYNDNNDNNNDSNHATNNENDDNSVRREQTSYHLTI